MTKREFAIEIVQRLRGAGFEALWAGGCVRDQLLGLEPKDYDVATSARPEQVRQLFRRTVEVGAALERMASSITQPPAVSAERIRDELQKLLVHPRRGRAVNLLYDAGLAAPIVPELLEMKGLPQGPPSAPTGDLWDHVIRVLDLL